MELNPAIAARARAREQLTGAELVELDGSDVLSLGMLADEVRRARIGDRVTYTRVLEVGVDARTVQLDTTGLDAAGEVRLMNPLASLEDTLAAIARVRALSGTRRVTGFALDDVVTRRFGALHEVLTRMKQAGLDAISEAPIDAVSREDVQVAAAAGLGPDRLSVRRWQGGGTVDLLARMGAALAVLEAVPIVCPLSREQLVATPTTGYQDVKLVALARLAFPHVKVIEVDWAQYGPKLAQVALLFGANHLDRVSPWDDPALGRRRSTAEEVRRNITAAGFTPIEPGEAA